MRHKRVSQDVAANKSLIKKCQNVIENSIDRVIFDPLNCEKMPQIPPSRNLTENKQVISCCISAGQYVGEKIGDKTSVRSLRP
jgi:hypothetical protein